MEQGNMEGARIFAQNAIRKKNEAMNQLRLASRLDAVASRLDTAVKMNTVTKVMGGVVTSLDTALSSMDMTKVSQVMMTFEKQFEDLDVRAEFMEKTMGDSAATLVTPEDEVSTLMNEVRDEYGLESAEKFGAANPSEREIKAESEDLSARLRKLNEKQH